MAAGRCRSPYGDPSAPECADHGAQHGRHRPSADEFPQPKRVTDGVAAAVVVEIGVDVQAATPPFIEARCPPSAGRRRTTGKPNGNPVLLPTGNSVLTTVTHGIRYHDAVAIRTGRIVGRPASIVAVSGH